jgi:hypothetical protein
MHTAFSLTSRSTEAMEEGSYRSTEVSSYRLDSGTAPASREYNEITRVHAGNPLDSGSGHASSKTLFFIISFLCSALGASLWFSNFEQSFQVSFDVVQA